MLLAHNADVNLKDTNCWTALHVAAMFGQNDVAEWLLAHGATYSFLEVAEIGDLPRVRSMLNADPTLISSRDEYGRTALHAAALRGHKDIVELLLANRADVNSQVFDISFRMHMEPARGHKVDPNAKRKDGTTPLHLAAAQGHKEVVEMLLAHGAEVNATADDAAKMPLHFAADNGYSDVAELLLAHGAEVNARNRYGWTPLQLAAEHGYKDVAEVLLAHKAEYTIDELAAVDDMERIRPMLKDHPDLSSSGYLLGWMPLHYAVENGHKDMVELLLANNANVNARDELGETALEWAAYYGLTDMVELLLAHGAQVNTRDGYDGSSPLHKAAQQGHLEVVKLLLAHHADVNAQENNGWTPLDESNEYGEIAELLRRHGGHE